MKRKAKILSAILATSVLLPSGGITAGAEQKGEILINEVESDAPDKGNDWVEIINTGSAPVDISGWFLTDDKGLERLTEGKTTPLPENTILNPGEVLVLEETKDFDFGLGKSDTATLYNKESTVADSYAYTSVANGTWSRQPDGSFADAPSSKGAVNSAPEVTPEKPSLTINEINSSPDDWVELMNTGDKALDISGFEIRDNSDDHRWRFPEGTSIAPGELLVVDAKSTGLIYDDVEGKYVEGTFEAAIGIGSGDSIRLFDKEGQLIEEFSWTEHASFEGDAAKASFGRYPDGKGDFRLTKETKGTANEFHASTVVINEVESNGDTTDWAEIINTGKTPVDISGWYILDNDPVGHKADVTPVPSGTILEAGEVYVFDQNKDFTFGLGKADNVTVYDKDGVVVDTYSWEAHANGVYARIPDGTGEFTDTDNSTKGKLNKKINPVVINEVQSDDKNGGADWVELANPTSEPLDISGIVMLDSKDKNPYTFPENTIIPANGFLVIYQDDSGENGFMFGLGKGDSVRLFENGEEITSTTWPEDTHTNPTWGLYPDVNGESYENTLTATPGEANKFAGIPDVIPWPGSDKVEVWDTNSTFLEDSSGLDFADGKLYAVDNGTATFWIMEVANDGTISFAPGFEKGKQVCFIKDKDNPDAKGPDAEGITVDPEGMVYLACERDNSDKGVNFNAILMADPNTAGTRITAVKEWDLTSLLPTVSANMGIEAVEWVSNENVAGMLIDKNTGKAFDPALYPDATAKGVFFTALEDNGHVYAFVLNNDGTAVLIADIDSKLGGAMALDYDVYENALWVAADDGYENRMAKITFNKTEAPDIVHVLPGAEVNTTANNEGFAIAGKEYTANGLRPVYRFCDGVVSGALTVGYINCDYVAQTVPEVTTEATTNAPEEIPETTPDTTTKAPEETPETLPSTTTQKPTSQPVIGDSESDSPQTGRMLSTLPLMAGAGILAAAIATGISKKHKDE